MSIKSLTKTKPDDTEEAVLKALQQYVLEHPDAEVVTYRQNPVSIRIRVIDPVFANLDRVGRQEILEKVIEKLPDDVQEDITQVLLLTPEEAEKSFANFEFDNPIPSQL
ncbi:MAG TPA: hypothetical protein VHD36_11925 [Pirellulales bacterium]|nr:hypothetical protein [Pirellulales bacterium]